jgi:hypothetical protein
MRLAGNAVGTDSTPFHPIAGTPLAPRDSRGTKGN